MPKGPTLNVDSPLIKPVGGGPIYLVDDGKKNNRCGFDWSRVSGVDIGRYQDGSVIQGSVYIVAQWICMRQPSFRAY
jgi:hypothetical protein